MRVFIVDDSVLIQNRLKSLAASIENVEVVGQGYNVSDGIRGIEELGPDAVILDIRMPGGSGLDVLDALKHGDHKPIFIILTNYPYPQYRKIAYEKGAKFFFDKSLEFEKVTDALEDILTRLSDRTG